MGQGDVDLLFSNSWERWVRDGSSPRDLVWHLLRRAKQEDQDESGVARVLGNRSRAKAISLIHLWRALGRPDVRRWDRFVQSTGATHAEVISFVLDHLEAKPELVETIRGWQEEIKRLKQENRELREQKSNAERQHAVVAVALEAARSMACEDDDPETELGIESLARERSRDMLRVARSMSRKERRALRMRRLAQRGRKR